MKYITMPLEEYDELKDSMSLKNRIEELTVENRNLRHELMMVNERLVDEMKVHEKVREECRLLRMGTEVFKEYEFMFKKGNFLKKMKVLFK